MKIGFIGCGRAAQTVHLPWFAASEQCEITTLVDRRVELASELASRYGIGKVAGDHRVLCDDPDIEAVVMILREPLHAPVGIDLLRAGKHVFTEKPLSDRLPEARRLVDAAAETGRLLMVGYMRRYDPGIDKARELLAEVRASGELGRVVQVRLHIHGGGGSGHEFGSSEPVTTAEEKPPVPTGPDDGLPAEVHQLSWSTNFIDTHLSDMLIHLLDPVREILFADMDPETRSRMFIYDHGGYKSVHTGSRSVVGPRDESMVVYFEKGRLTIRPSSNFRRDEHARVELLRGAGPSPVIERPLVAGPWCFRAQAEHFLRCVRTGERPRCTGEDAMANAELLHATLGKLAGQGP